MATLCETLEFGERKDIGIVVFGVETDLLGVEPVHQQAKCIEVAIWENHGFGGAFDEFRIVKRT